MSPHPIYKQLGAMIQRRRKQLRYKQEEVARDLGISRGSLANIETGRQSMLVHQLYRFAEVLKLSVTDLLPATLPAPPAPQEDWSGKLPPDLKPSQQQQIALLLEGSPTGATTPVRVSNAKLAKR